MSDLPFDGDIGKVPTLFEYQASENQRAVARGEAVLALFNELAYSGKAEDYLATDVISDVLHAAHARGYAPTAVIDGVIRGFLEDFENEPGDEDALTAHLLSETSPSLILALRKHVGDVVGQHDLNVHALHTGGGVMVMCVDLSLDGRGIGRQMWLTREGPNEWLVGFYDGEADDDGVTLVLRGFQKGPTFSPDDPTAYTSNDPEWVAEQVAGVLRRLGFTSLDRA